MEGCAVTGLHILHVIVPQRQGAIGGADLHVRDLARAQREHEGCDVSVFAPRAPKHYLDLLTAAGLDTVPATRDVRTLARLPNERRVTLVHAHGYESSYFVAILRAAFPAWRRLPTAMTAHGWIETTVWLRFKSALDRLASRTAHVRIASASRHAPRLRGRGQTRVIHNGVPAPASSAQHAGGDAARGTRYEIPLERPVVGLVGRLSTEKRPDLFLRVAHALSSEHDAHFVLVGGGDMYDSLVALAGQLDITDKLTFTGLIDDVDSVYAMLDVLVQPSDTEGTPRTVVEAMAHSVPVVATNVGDVAEVLDHGRCGMLTTPGDLASLTRAVASLLSNPRGAQRLGERGRERYFQRYTLEAMSNQVHDAYQAAIDLAVGGPRQGKGAQ